MARYPDGKVQLGRRSKLEMKMSDFFFFLNGAGLNWYESMNVCQSELKD